MTKRLKYTKDILTHMLSNNTNGTQASKGSTQPLASAQTKRGTEQLSDMRGGSSNIASAQTNRKPFNILN